MADLFTPEWDNVICLNGRVGFANRPKEYGAYQLRKQYQRNISRALIASLLFFTL